MPARFVSYDIRAIQSFIFRAPKLRHISGGSAMVDEFDRVIAPRLGNQIGCEVILAAGGKGCFKCGSLESADTLQKRLVEEAHEFGMDIRLGNEETFDAAAKNATRCYSFMPPDCDGEPCAMSGLFPVAQGSVHETIRKRASRRGETRNRRFEDALGGDAEHLGALLGSRFRFLSSVSQDGEIGGDDAAEGDAGLASLGHRRRWAIITMDGNDMGRQYAAARKHDPDPVAWVQRMSKALDACCKAALYAGLREVVSRWSASLDEEQLKACTVTDPDNAEAELVLPFRPLLVGGDDIVVICHAQYAFDFVRKATAAWQRASEQAYDGFDAARLWPATNGSITVSAGVLFCPVTMPLHAAIPYAEALLAMAKGAGRGQQVVDEPEPKPSPSCIDWESITESVMDHPEHRRRRELEFLDGDAENKRIRLTKRPYTMVDFEALYTAAGVNPDAGNANPILPEARSVLAGLLPAMRQAKSDRLLTALRMRKRNGLLADIVAGPSEKIDDDVVGWKVQGAVHTVGLLDAVAIREECERTAPKGAAR